MSAPTARPPITPAAIAPPWRASAGCGAATAASPRVAAAARAVRVLVLVIAHFLWFAEFLCVQRFLPSFPAHFRPAATIVIDARFLFFALMAREWPVWNSTNRLFCRIKFWQCLRRHGGKRHVVNVSGLLRQAPQDALQDSRPGAAARRMSDDLTGAVARCSAARARLVAEHFCTTAAELGFANLAARLPS